MSAALPVVLVPVGTDDEALDACLGALDAAACEEHACGWPMMRRPARAGAQ